VTKKRGPCRGRRHRRPPKPHEAQIRLRDVRKPARTNANWGQVPAASFPKSTFIANKGGSSIPRNNPTQIERSGRIGLPRQLKLGRPGRCGTVVRRKGHTTRDRSDSAAGVKPPLYRNVGRRPPLQGRPEGCFVQLSAGGQTATGKARRAQRTSRARESHFSANPRRSFSASASGANSAAFLAQVAASAYCSLSANA